MSGVAISLKAIATSLICSILIRQTETINLCVGIKTYLHGLYSVILNLKTNINCYGAIVVADMIVSNGTAGFIIGITAESSRSQARH